MALPNRRGGCGRTMGYWFSIRTPTGTSMTSASCLGTQPPISGEAGVRPGSRNPCVVAKGLKTMLAVAEPCGCPARFADTGGAQTRYAQTVCRRVSGVSCTARLGTSPEKTQADACVERSGAGVKKLENTVFKEKISPINGLR